MSEIPDLSVDLPADPPAAAARAAVLDVERRWTTAHLAGDFATIAKLMADDNVRIQPDGSVGGRAVVLAAYQPEHGHWDYAVSDPTGVHTAPVADAGLRAGQTTVMPSTLPHSFSPFTSDATAAGRRSPSSPPKSADESTLRSLKT